MPVAEIIAIGTELLLGQIQDSNTAYIARVLNESGIDIFRATIIGDNENRIAGVIQETIKRADVIITTGGLGPTVDDPTRSAVALAFDVQNEYHPELWEEIQTRFKAYGRSPSENNKRQAYLPGGAKVIHNPVGTAPAFYVESGNKIIFSLPGVPSEMKTLLHIEVIPKILEKYDLECVIVTRVIHTIGIGESSVDELVADMESLHNPTVGLAAHPGQVDIRITAKARTRDDALTLIHPLEIQLEERLGKYIYGIDQTTIFDVVLNLLNTHGLNMRIFCPPDLLELASTFSESFGAQLEVIENPEFRKSTSNRNNFSEKPETLLLKLENPYGLEKGVDLEGYLLNNKHVRSSRFGGHPSLYRQWAINQIMNFIREIILKERGVK